MKGTNDMNIRKANEKDVSSNLVNLYVDLFKRHHENRGDMFKEKTIEEANKELNDIIKNHEVLVIEENNEVIGFVYYDITTRGNGQKILVISQIAVDNNYKRKGYATKLMEEVKRVTIQNECVRIELGCFVFNDDAISFYKHFGFDEQRIIMEMKM